MRRRPALRTTRGPAEALHQHLIDEVTAGRLNRRQVLRVGTALGLSLPAASLLAACSDDGGNTSPGAGPASGRAVPGATIRVGVLAPDEDLQPATWGSDAGKALAVQVGDFLVWSNEELALEPRLATKWTPNADATVWTFTIRSDVKFSDGQQLTARDVASTMNFLADPKNGSYALGYFQGVLSTGGVTAKGDTTVIFTLDRPTANFPFLVSNENFNAIILPANYEPGNWAESGYVGTGPWRVKELNSQRGITFMPNAEYWDKTRAPLPAQHEMRFFPSAQAIFTAMQAGQLEVIVSFAVGAGAALMNSPKVTVQEHSSSTHVQVHMRCDQGPFVDKRVRQALALSIDRSALVDGLMQGTAELGNDSPFAPVYPSTAPSTAQRQQDLAQAKSLLEAAGASGISSIFYGDSRDEASQLAVGLQSAFKEIGVTIAPLNIVDDVTYYNDHWLDSDIGLETYGHRSVPDLFLTAPLQSGGSWNAAHFNNTDYDRLVDSFLAELDLQVQKKLSTQIQDVLVEETPILVSYFKKHLGAVSAGLVGAVTTPTYQYDITRAGFTS